MKQTRSLEKAQPQIVKTFDSDERGVFLESGLKQILEQNAEQWRLSPSVTLDKLREFLIEKNFLRELTLDSELYSPMRRYAWRDANNYQVALSLKPRAYLSHGTAAFLHGLGDQIPKTIYVNHEQSPKPKPIGILTQERLAQTFARPQRTSRYSYRIGSDRIIIVNGKNTERLGVTPLDGPDGKKLDVTSIERTLIDIVVRPSYAGGIFRVLETYHSARDRISAKTLLEILKKLDYVYPYHQCIGFLMERADYPAGAVEPFRKIGASLDFYLVYGLRQPEYDKKWHLFYPKGL